MTILTIKKVNICNR